MSTLYLEEQAAPGTPSTGKVVLYPKVDGFFYSKDDAGTESKITVTSATTTTEGLVELATQAEMDAGTAGKAVTTGLNKVSLGAPIVTTSGTAHDFTVPSGTRRVSVNFAGVSLSGADHLLVQIGPSAGPETTGYVSTCMNALAAPSVGIVTSTAGFIITGGSAARIFSGRMVLELLDESTNEWVSSVSGKQDTASGCTGGGDKAIAGPLINVRVTRTGTDTFDAGKVNITSER